MTDILIQDAVVTLVALTAAGVVLRRVVSFVVPSRPTPPCSSCGSARTACGAQPRPSTAAPLQIIRHSR